jgi:hypothetical protein
MSLRELDSAVHEGEAKGNGSCSNAEKARGGALLGGWEQVVPLIRLVALVVVMS